MRPCVRYVIVGLGAAGLACGNGSSGPAATPSEIQVTPLVFNLILGTSQQLGVTVLDVDGRPIPTAPLRFSSSDTTVAKVNATGLVTAVGVGAAAITVRSTPASATVAVNAFSPSSVDLTPHSALLTSTETVQLTAIARDASGNVIPAAPITYTSRDPTIVTVSATGVASRVGVGTTNVLATSGLASDSSSITALIARLTVTGTPFGAAVSSDGVSIVTQAYANTVARLDLPTPAVTATVSVGSLPSSVAFNSAGDRAYVGNQEGASVSVVNVGTNSVIETFPTNGSVTALAVGPADKLLFVATDASRVYVVRLPILTLIDSLPLPAFSNALAIRDTLLFASSPFAGRVSTINLRTRQVATTLHVGGVPQGLVVARGGRELYVANETGTLQIWNLAANALTASVPLPGGGGFGLARNPANGLLYVSTSYYGSRVHVIDPVARRVVRVILTGGVPRRIGFTPSGSVGIVANESGWVDFIK
jgi:YVTN family beta-propeller protein